MDRPVSSPTRTFGAILLGCGLLLAAGQSRAQASPGACTSTNVTRVPQQGAPNFCGDSVTKNGQLIYAYLGIPYAGKPVASGRWQRTSMLTTLPTAANQTQYGQPCLQVVARDSVDSKKQPLIVKDTVGGDDCLYLNVWTPASQLNGSATPAPVMVFIHGGAYVEGSGGFPLNFDTTAHVDSNLYNGANMASQGIVVVTLNYRLGALGFFGGTLKDKNTIPYSLGITDQQNAINWVVKNARLFGGDPTKITLFGESAGAMSVGLHTFSVPSNRNANGVLPWQGAILESNPFGAYYPPPNNSRVVSVTSGFIGSICRQRLHLPACPDTNLVSKLSVLQDSTKVTRSMILKAQDEIRGMFTDLMVDGPFNLPWTPVLDGTYITREPFTGFDSTATPIPVGFGVNQNEGAVFAGIALHTLGDLTLSGFYDSELKRIFTADTAARIKSYPRYSPDSLKKGTIPTYASATSLAFGNMITDYAFWCGNLAAMNAALQSKNANKVFGYLFDQQPFTDIYNLADTAVYDSKKSQFYGGDNGACEPTASPSNVCHANELAYVFNTLVAVSRGGKLNYQPTANDKAIALSMDSAWVAFGKNPSNPGAYWTAYAKATSTGGGAVGQWANGKMNAPVSLNTQITHNGVGTPMCTDLWMHQPPYNGQAPGPSIRARRK